MWMAGLCRMNGDGMLGILGMLWVYYITVSRFVSNKSTWKGAHNHIS